MKPLFLWLLLVIDRLSLWIENMANSFYNVTGQPASATRGRSINLREEFALVEDGFDGVETALGLKAPAASPTFSGDVTWSGTGNRFKADFSNATVNLRAMFQTTTANAMTSLSAIPNGTGQASALVAYTGVDPYNASNFVLRAGADQSEVSLQSNAVGTGTLYPITFKLGGTEAMRLTTNRRLLVGTSTENTSGAKLQTSDGITFPATQVASSDPNTLDDYREGTFTGTLTGMAVPPSVDVSYVRVGNKVTLCTASGSAGAATGSTLILTGLPAFLTPSVTRRVIASTQDGSDARQAAATNVRTDSTIQFYKDLGLGAFVSTGNRGLDPFTISYIL